MGHNLGMHHDFDNSNRQPRRGTNGKACYGYMDYKESTNFWSQCSVDDFTGTEKGCLQKLGTTKYSIIYVNICAYVYKYVCVILSNT